LKQNIITPILDKALNPSENGLKKKFLSQLCLLLCLSSGFSVFGQEEKIEVRTLRDMGDVHPSFSMCVIPLEGSAKFASQDLSLNMRTYGFLEIQKETLGVYYNLGHGIYNNNEAFVFNNQSGYNLSSDIDISFYYLFRKLNDVKKTTVRVKSSYLMNSYKYFNADAKWSALKGLKLGFTSINADMYIDGLNKTRFFPYLPNKSYDLNIGLKGFSIGYFRRTYSHLLVEEVENRKRHSGIGGSIFYADILAFPFQTFTDRQLLTDQKDSVKSIGSIAPIGLRLGFKTFVGSNKALEREAVTIEAGYLPYHGISLSVGFGLCIFNKHEGNII
jgi:hypothetical protein